MVEYLHKTKIHQFPSGSSEQSPFQFAHKGCNLWEFLDQNPEQRRYFDDFMAARRAGTATWYKTFPFADILLPGARESPHSVLLVDIGGNQGHDIISFRDMHPNAPGRLILQDLPNMIEKLPNPSGIECMPYNFFEGARPVRGARAYYMHNICHDWSDEKCETILKHTAQVMEKGYPTLLIDDFVLPSVNTPLRGCTVDFLMMLFLSGMERTMSQFSRLLDRCGLEVVKCWSYRTDVEQILEVMLKD